MDYTGEYRRMREDSEEKLAKVRETQRNMEVLAIVGLIIIGIIFLAAHSTLNYSLSLLQ